MNKFDIFRNQCTKQRKLICSEDWLENKGNITLSALLWAAEWTDKVDILADEIGEEGKNEFRR